MPKASTSKQKLEKWLNDPTLPYEGWVTLTYAEIAEQAGVSRSSVDRHLVIVVAQCRGHSVAEVKRRRYTAWAERVGRMTPAQLERLHRYRTESPPVSHEECAVRLNVSLWSVQYQCKKEGL